MDSISSISSVRFGYGLGADNVAVEYLPDMLQSLSKPDDIRDQFPVWSAVDAQNMINAKRKLRHAFKEGDQEAIVEFKRLNKEIVTLISHSRRQMIARAAFSKLGFRERLVQFWADHFTVERKSVTLGAMIPSYIDLSIRPNLIGSFADILTACTLSPAMLTYLDQIRSIGPNSRVGLKRSIGLNENLARELLELHTMGVSGDYKQSDVRQLAELLTGLRLTPSGDLTFRPIVSEPGTKFVLGNTYGQKNTDLDDIKSFLIDVSQRPETARNIATKLAVHFISDEPDEAVVNHVAARFLDTQGDLLETYGALLEHPASATPIGQKVKQPFDYIASGMRAFHMKPKMFTSLTHKQFRRNYEVPMRLMGQHMFLPNGPDGWPEEASAWITPTGLAGRLQWAMQISQAFTNHFAPHRFMYQALGERVSDDLAWAVPKAASRQEGLAIVLASPEFNRR